MDATRKGSDLSARRPNLFIVGAPKCGTTSLHAYLAQHPDVFMSWVKEPRYFSPDVRAAQAPGLAFGREESRYLALFAEAHSEAWVGESSTSYLMSEMAPRLIKEFAPDARIIVMVRDPIDLIESLHNERVSSALESERDLEAALELDSERLAGRHLPDGLNERGAAYRENAWLGRQLSRWLDEFGRDRVHVVVLDDLAAEPQATYRRVLQFLGVDDSFVPVFEVHNPSHRRRPLVRRLVKTPFLRPLRPVLAATLGEQRTRKLSRFVRKRLARRSFKRAPMPTQLRQRLESEFSGDVELLGELISRDLRAKWFGRSAADEATTG